MKKLAVPILFVILLVISGCQTSSVIQEEAVNALMDENVLMSEKIEGLASRVRSLEQNSDILLGLIDEQVTILSSELDENMYITLPIHHLDITTFEPRAQYYVMMQSDWSLEQKVEHLAEKLSRYSFDGLPIELLEINQLNQRNIAVINLIDPEDREGSIYQKTWAGNYFQGTSGGYATTFKLINTFLQEDYDGEWVDGVEFRYNYDVINDFDHIDLGATYLSYIN